MAYLDHVAEADLYAFLVKRNSQVGGVLFVVKIGQSNICEHATQDVSFVGDVPQEFKDWVEENSQRIDNARRKGGEPYFLKDNQTRIDKILSASKDIKHVKDVEINTKEVLTNNVTKLVTPQIIQIRRIAIQSDDFPTSTAHFKFDNLITTNLYLGKKSLARIINHCISAEEVDAVKFIWKNPDKMKNPRISPLGEGKDLTTEQAQKKILNKRKRGVLEYIEYEFEFANETWLIKTEHHRAGFEQFYHLRKK